MRNNIVIEGLLYAFCEDVDDAIETANYDIQDLKEKLGVEFADIEQAKGFTPEALARLMDERKAELLGNGKFVPKTIKAQFEDEFNRLYNECEPIAARLQGGLLKLQRLGLSPTVAGGKITLQDAAVKRQAQKAATVKFTPQEMELGAGLESVSKSLNELNQLCAAQGRKPLLEIEKALTTTPTGYVADEFVLYRLTRG